MKNRPIFIALLFVFVSCGLFAQQEEPLHYNQIGINFTNLNSFGVHFKTGSEKTMLRFTLLTMNMGQTANWGRPQDSIDIKNRTYGAGFRLGFEKHVRLAPKFNVIWGMEA